VKISMLVREVVSFRHEISLLFYGVICQSVSVTQKTFVSKIFRFVQTPHEEQSPAPIWGWYNHFLPKTAWMKKDPRGNLFSD
jgi:hypothetical protein